MTKEEAIKELELLHVTAAAPAGSVAGEHKAMHKAALAIAEIKKLEMGVEK